MTDDQYTGTVLDGPLAGRTLSHWQVSKAFKAGPQENQRQLIYVWNAKNATWQLDLPSTVVWRQLNVVSVSALIDAAVAVSGLTKDDLTGPKRHMHISSVRQIIMYLARQNGHSLHMVARVFKRDHTTIQHGCNVIERRLEEGNRRIEQLIKEIKEKSNGCV